MSGFRDRLVDAEFMLPVRPSLERDIAERFAGFERDPTRLNGLVQLLFRDARLTYCEGAPLEVVKERFEFACEHLVRRGEDGEFVLNRGYRGTTSTLDVAALLYLFGLDELRERARPVLIDLVREHHPGWAKLRLHDFLMLDPDVWDDANYVFAEDEFSLAGWPLEIEYVTMEVAAECRADPAGSADLLYQFVDGLWLPGWVEAYADVEDGMGWYYGEPPLHGSVAPALYTGYWCFEAAAIARMFGVDDSRLEGHKHYPYDLAHYLD